MPIYEYKCEDCGTVTEVLQKMSDKPLKKCPKCSGNVEKIISRSSFQLKGSGWYVTDYGKGTGGTAGTKKSKSSDSDEGSKSEKSEKSEKAEKAEKADRAEKRSEASASETKSKPKKSSAKSGD